ncbi:MAG: FadR/GntR family transcriptional regulator [Vulcanimicrobiaceae bacterium]
MLILQNDLRGGDRLPPERDLAVALNVSRGALREAQRLLEAAGVVVIRHGRGVFIGETGAEERLTKTLVPARTPAINKRELTDLYQLRCVLESEAAAWAAARVGPNDVAALNANCDRGDLLLRAGGRDIAPITTLHAEFHRSILELSGNSVVVRVMDGLMDLLSESRRYTIHRPGRTAKTCSEHREITEAIGALDPVAARAAMLRHVRSVEATAFERSLEPT